jgi:iron complex transport system ATP-binding protein
VIEAIALAAALCETGGMPTEIVVRAVVQSFHREERDILDNVAIEIQRGEHWALLGPNGAGKTSLLRILAGYEWPSRGVIEVLGSRYGQVELRELRKRIGLVSHALDCSIPGRDGALDIVLSGLEASLGLWRDFAVPEQERAARALEAIGAGHLASSRYSVLSQGERQRVLIARALVRDPSLLILDEACGGLDPVAREAFLTDLDALVARPEAPSVLFVTHHLDEIPSFVRHALLLSGGRAVAGGPIDEVLTETHLSRAFGAPCIIEKRDGRYALRVASAPAG